MNLAELLSKNYDYIEKVYTNSEHSGLAKTIMNEILEEHPEYRDTLFVLSSYKVQKWATECRNNVGLSRKDLLIALEYMIPFFGFKSCKMDMQLKAQDITDALILLVGTKLKGKAILAVHGDTEDVSKYIMSKYYKDELLVLCKSLYKDINKLIKPLRKIIDQMDEDYKFILHDAEVLIKLNPLIKENAQMRKSTIDFEDVSKIMQKCIECLKSYPFNGYDTYNIVSKYSQGVKEYIIAKQISKSRTYVRSRYKEGANAIAYIIWGYANKNIL